ncbi:two-component system response regulator TorR [Endozoicomonas sp. OPT23]|uniref:two-component system response regulator TorR n=1 Tax=Endozoicomonas sp. OPT23 TaxID=2072845 RepID=UPI00129C04DF|nr:two-component system response regulator TorR [Endozoicomonas sp. OPT23]MRI32789.1 two-component system response regulator TorR [Endozoicomonas sp. OPT23]
MSHHVLVVEDEPVTRARLVGYFRCEGYRVSEADSGEAMMDIFSNEKVDLILLDINLPGIDGLSLTRQLRSQSTVGIILVTGRSDTIDRVVGLEMGADDYVVKPVELRELLVRVKNLLWRISLCNAVTEPEEKDDFIIRFGECRIDTQRRELYRGDQPVTLTGAEYELLLAFVTHTGMVLNRERLLSLTSHRREAPGDRTIDTLVRRLRHKLEEHPGQPVMFKTIHGEGYLFTETVF